MRNSSIELMLRPRNLNLNWLITDGIKIHIYNVLHTIIYINEVVHTRLYQVSSSSVIYDFIFYNVFSCVIYYINLFYGIKMC